MGIVQYTARFELPTLIEQGRANSLTCRTYRGGELAAPSSGTVTVYDASNTALISAAAVTVTNSVATYSLASATVSASARSAGWRIEWALVMPDGITHRFRNDAALCKSLLYPAVTEADLYRVASSLDPRGPACIHSEPSFEAKLDEAFTQLESRLIERGNRPNLILSPSALREAHLYLTLALIFEDFATRLNPAYEARAMGYREAFKDALERFNFVYDTGDDGAADGGATVRRGKPVLWLGGR